jgi:hypothetical protein
MTIVDETTRKLVSLEVTSDGRLKVTGSGGGGGGASAYTGLTDKASVNLPSINTPLASALSTLTSNVAAKADAAATTAALSGKQASLVSGTNIKTINGSSILGSGDLVVSGGSGPSSTDALTEGSTNLYFTQARVRAAPLTSLDTTTTGAVSATSTVLEAVGRFIARFFTKRLFVGQAYANYDANSIGSDDPHLLEVTNDPAQDAGPLGAGYQFMRFNSYGASYGGNIHFCRYQGSVASPSSVNSSNYFMSFGFRSYASGSLQPSAAAYQYQATENHTSTAMGGKFIWQVTQNGSASRNTAFEVGAVGNGNVAQVTGSLGVAGAVKATSPTGTYWEMVIAASDESTAITAGTGKVTFRMPRAVTLTAVRASLTTAQSAGSIFTVDINEAGSTILSTKLTIDNTEKSSTTAATAAVISDTALADDAEITIDVDQIGTSGATGLKITLIGTIA